MDYQVGDLVTLKKPHPCGSRQWEVLRVGADFRLKCCGCGHQIMIARKLVEKNTKEIQKKVFIYCYNKNIYNNYISKSKKKYYNQIILSRYIYFFF